MELIIIEDQLKAYLEETSIINFSQPSIQKQIILFEQQGKTTIEKIDLAFRYTRDYIQHSFDCADSGPVTISASDVLEMKEGICFAKAHLLAAFIRGMGIPAGFCYQKVTRKGTIESGYALHGLNAVYVTEVGKWLRIDPRGNKPGIYSEFRTDKEVLAYKIHTDKGEIDYPYVFARPLKSVIEAMESASDSEELFYKRPEFI